MASFVPNACAKDKKSGKSMVPDPLKSARGSAGMKIADPDKVTLIVPLLGSSERMLIVPDKVLSAFGLYVMVMSFELPAGTENCVVERLMSLKSV